MDVFLIYCRRFYMSTPIFLAVIGAKYCPRNGQDTRNQRREGGHFQGTQGTDIYMEETFRDVMNLNDRMELTYQSGFIYRSRIVHEAKLGQSHVTAE